ncbi:uncharacterized protein LOC105848128 [Hydra vulgaris]|uniref:uncharacterized protein LOC105848128 n=1 Tax=Hydra vulgaris TaxID=6087 RepID=UPI0032E9EA59
MKNQQKINQEKNNESELEYLKVEKFSSDVLDTIANELQNDWIKLARFLGISKKEIRRVKLEFKTAREQSYEILHSWCRYNPDKTWNDLKSVLKFCECKDAINKCERTFTDVKNKLELNQKENYEYEFEYLKVEKLSRDVINTFANELQNDWIKLARFWCISKKEIKRITREYKTARERSYEMLNSWCRYNPDKTWNDLKSVLFFCERKDVIIKCEKTFKDVEDQLELNQEENNEFKCEYVKVEKLSSDVLNTFADELPNDWIKLARFLGISRKNIKKVKCKYETSRDQSYEILSRWCRNNPDKTWSGLKSGLLFCGRKDVINKCERSKFLVLSFFLLNSSALFLLA